VNSKPPHGGEGRDPHHPGAATPATHRASAHRPATPHGLAAHTPPPHAAGGRAAASKPAPARIPPPLASGKPPRSPRAALEPERVPAPKRRSKRARHPLVIVGNAIFTVLVVVALAVGVTVWLMAPPSLQLANTYRVPEPCGLVVAIVCEPPEGQENVC
jgi:hypothetical protein